MKDHNGVEVNETSTAKGRDGWQCSTDFHLHGNRYLHINTSKRSSGGISSHASCVKIEHHDTGFSSMSFAMFGDFSKTVEYDRTVKCTEKTVKAMHEKVLLRKDEILAEAGRFYLAKDEERAHEENDKRTPSVDPAHLAQGFANALAAANYIE